MLVSHYDRVKKIRRKYLANFERETQIVDIGCGDGSFLKLLKDENFSAVGVDVADTWVEKYKECGLDVYIMDAIEYLENNHETLGGIVCSHVIEHMAIDLLKRFIRACHDALSLGGKLLIITPNVGHISGGVDFWDDPTHVRPYTLGSLRLLIDEFGFKIVRSGYDSESRLPPKKCGIGLLLYMVRTAFGLFCYGRAGRSTEIYVVAQKVPKTV